MAKSYKKRLQIPLEGNGKLKFYNKSGTHLATGYERVVIGGRGPYIEFNCDQIVGENLQVKPDEGYRVDSNLYYYIDLRSIDECNTKVYVQKRKVAYADYKVNMCYISPFDLVTKSGQPIII